jgi:hypothetical protein
MEFHSSAIGGQKTGGCSMSDSIIIEESSNCLSLQNSVNLAILGLGPEWGVKLAITTSTIFETPEGSTLTSYVATVVMEKVG